jgi:uncharacterized protein YihD (DUF1040 family)
MRDKNRIPKIIKQLQVIWEQNPDLRLGQLITNLYNTEDMDVYIMEDIYLINALRDLYETKS